MYCAEVSPSDCFPFGHTQSAPATLQTFLTPAKIHSVLFCPHIIFSWGFKAKTWIHSMIPTITVRLSSHCTKLPTSTMPVNLNELTPQLLSNQQFSPSTATHTTLELARWSRLKERRSRGFEQKMVICLGQILIQWKVTRKQQHNFFNVCSLGYLSHISASGNPKTGSTVNATSSREMLASVIHHIHIHTHNCTTEWLNSR